MIARTFLGRSLLWASLAMAGMTESAQASEAQINFQSQVLSGCVFGTPEPGVLAIDSLTVPIQLSSQNLGGKPGSVLLKCSTKAKVEISGYQSNGKQFNFNSVTATLATNEDKKGSKIIQAKQGETQIFVNLTLDSQKKNPIPEGNYSYSVVITATP
jgi:hypothetical protein